jgi:hypothetical protein
MMNNFVYINAAMKRGGGKSQIMIAKGRVVQMSGTAVAVDVAPFTTMAFP